MAKTQISARISNSTKVALERHVKQCGVEKSRVIEEALLHHFQALTEIPEDVIIPVRLVLGERSMQEVVDRLSADEKPSENLKALFSIDRGLTKCA